MLSRFQNSPCTRGPADVTLGTRDPLPNRVATTDAGTDGVAQIAVATTVGVAAPLKDVGTATGIPAVSCCSIVLHGGMFVPLQVLGTGIPPRAKSGELGGSATLGNSRTECCPECGGRAGEGERVTNEGDGT